MKKEQKKRPHPIRTIIIGFEIYGSLYVLFAILNLADIQVRFEYLGVVGALALSIPVFVLILFSFNFFAQRFSKTDDTGIKIVLVYLMFLPVLAHYGLSRLKESIEFLSFEYEFLNLLLSLITAGFWFSLSIWLRKSFPTKGESQGELLVQKHPAN